MKTLLLLAAVIVAAKADEPAESDYQARLNRLKESQAQTQAYLNRLTGFAPAPSIRATSEEEEAEKKHPLLRVHSDLKTVRVRTGSIYRGFNRNRLVIGGDSAPVIVELADGQGTLSGLTILGTAKPSGVDGRIQIEATRLIQRTGRVVPVTAVALDPSGAQGLPAQVFSGKALAVAGSLASSFVAGLAATKQSQVTNVFGFQQTPATGRNAILGGIAQTAADQSKRLIDEATAEKPILVLDERTPFAVFFNEEVRL